MASKEELVVIIKVGNHSWKPPRGMDKAFHEVLYACGVRGKREVLMGDIIRGANGAKKVEVGNFDPDTKCILFYSQPGSKDRRHQCTMIIPGEFRDNPEEFINKLYRETGDKRYVAPEPVVQLESPTYDFSKKGTHMTIEKSKRRESASKALKDETTLILILEHISTLFREKAIVSNSRVLSEIKDLDPGHKPRSIYLVLLRKGYISESDRTPKTAKVLLTDKSRELLARHGTKLENIQDLNEENMMSMLAGIGEEIEQFNFLVTKVASLEADIEELWQRIEKTKPELTKAREELELLGDIPAKRERIVKLLKLDKFLVK